MLFTAVLDACVLYPFSLRDSLLRLAERELYVPLWSTQILDEMSRNLIENYGMEENKATALATVMDHAFPEATVDEEEITRLEPAMPNEEKDRHVLAAAVAADSELIVTFNTRDFPTLACEPLGVEAVNPDRFLMDLFDLDPDDVVDAIRRQADDLVNPNVELADLLQMLETAGVPRFANAVHQHGA